MQGLMEKMEADAAARLTLPAGHQPAQELARYKGFLRLKLSGLRSCIVVELEDWKFVAPERKSSI